MPTCAIFTRPGPFPPDCDGEVLLPHFPQKVDENLEGTLFVFLQPTGGNERVFLSEQEALPHPSFRCPYWCPNSDYPVPDKEQISCCMLGIVLGINEIRLKKRDTKFM
jgi:hypothetical protein